MVIVCSMPVLRSARNSAGPAHPARLGTRILGARFSPSVWGSAVEFRALGPLEVVAGGQALALGGAQQRAVLALLLVCTPEAVSLDRLTDELWGDRPPATAQHALQVYVSRIRKVLRAGGGGVAVRSSRSGYALEVDVERVDARRFERLVGEAQRVLGGDPSRARDLFGGALELWHGPPLVEFRAVRVRAS